MRRFINIAKQIEVTAWKTGAGQNGTENGCGLQLLRAAELQMNLEVCLVEALR
jgi:hypothetical protein